jgi:hypothetical protein
MITMREMKERWETLDLQQEGANVINESQQNQETISELNREQLTKGLNKEGEKLRKYYDKGYAEMKEGMNPIPGYGNPDLKLTGDFYDSFETIADREDITITATDEKTSMLIEKYNKSGGDIFGLSSESIDVVREDILHPGLVANIADKTGCEIG